MSHVPVNLAVVPTEGASITPADAAEQRRVSEIERLFSMARNGEIPRGRELKPWEPASLSERHLAMVMARAGGSRQCDIALAFGATDSNVSVVLNHPDAVFILDRLQALAAIEPGDIQKRLDRLEEKAVSAMEDFFEAPVSQVGVVERAKMGFALLRQNGRGNPKKVEHDHKHRLQMPAEQVSLLSAALRESRQIEDATVLEISSSPLQQVSPGGEHSLLPPGAAAPPGGGPQEIPAERRSA